VGPGPVPSRGAELTDFPVQWHPSPNFGPRRDGLKPSLIVLHYTAMSSAGASLERLCDRDAEVSAHYLIGGDGTIWQMVDEKMRAWHAGEGAWQGQGDVNSRSIGIELDNTGAHPFSEPQMAALEALLPGIMQRWSIPPQGLIAHSDMAPGRKADPGWKFDWERLARQGLSVWPDRVEDDGQGDFATPETMRAFAQALAAFGYPAEDPPSPALLDAFCQRFAPGRNGFRACHLAMAQDLAMRFGIDRAGPTA
jgi:N-acetylmuramoyl-L-alanine amidase